MASSIRPAASLPEGSGTREWFTATELADLALPGLPCDKRSINRRAQEERWQSRMAPDGSLLVRKRAGRGGGTEYHASLLPGEARIELIRRGILADETEQEARDPGASGWPWYELQSRKTKAEAERRLSVVQEIELLEESGLTRTAAVAEIASRHAIGRATVWNWLGLIDGIDRANRLPALAPRRRGGGSQAEIDEEIWQMFLSDYLRLSKPTLTSCYERARAAAAERGLSVPSERTFSRRLKAEVSAQVQRLRREGEEALRRSAPAQRRTVEHLRVLEEVNIDGHKFDVFVQPPPHSRKNKPIRPTMVAIQDIRSSKILAWRVAETECSAVARLAFADLFRNWGIPKACTLDNGRGFASKWITGGAKSRFRFKVRDEEPTGLLTGLGIQIHWALPYRGQSKPIERAFRDLCDTIAKHPAMEGAYTGNSPLAKPENYGSRAIAWDAFVAHVNEGVALHNARAGRRGRDYAGRSFDQVFADLVEASPIGRATPEQLRMALLAADEKMVNRQTGEIELYGNRYWSPECSELHGQKVTVRFDPECLHREVYIYGQDGAFLCEAQLLADTGFDDVAGAKETAKRVKELKQRARDGEAAHRLLRAEEVAARQSKIREVTPIPEPGVIRPVRHAGQTAAALKTRTDARARPAPNTEQRQYRDPLDSVGRIGLRLVDQKTGGQD